MPIFPNVGFNPRPVGQPGTFLASASGTAEETVWRRPTLNDVSSGIHVLSFTIWPTALIVKQAVTGFLVSGIYMGTPSGASVFSASGGKQDLTTPFASMMYTGTFAGQTFGATYPFILTASGGVSAVAYASTSSTWMQRAFWGVVGTAPPYDTAWVTGLPNWALRQGHDLHISGLMEDGDSYLWYAYRLEAGWPKFTSLSNDVAGGFYLAASSIDFTNEYGFTEKYQLWRSLPPNDVGDCYLDIQVSHFSDDLTHYDTTNKIQIHAEIVPETNLATPVVDIGNVKGGFMSVSGGNGTDLDAIKSYNRSEGQFVHMRSEDRNYRLVSGSWIRQPNYYYEHTQSVASTSWIIDHQLGYNPNVTIVNTGNVTIQGNITHISGHTATLVRFNSPIKGSGFCS